MSTQPENELSTQKPAEPKNWIFPLSPLWDSATCFYCSDRAAPERKLYSIQFNHDETDCWIHLDCLKRAIAEVEQRDSPAQHESPSAPAAPSPPVAPPIEARVVAIQILAMTGRADLTVRQAIEEATQLITAYAACRSKEEE